MDAEPGRLRPHRRQHWGVEPDPDLEAQLVDPTVTLGPSSRRRVLWRDSATILIAVVVSLLAYQLLAPPATAPISGDPSSDPSAVVVIVTAAPRSFAPGETFGPIIDPNLGIDATPTPIPVITLGPTRKPGPTPTAKPGESAAPAPSATPRVTPRPTRTPRPATPPPPTPSPTPPPTEPPPPPTDPPPPPPTVSISCQTELASMTVTCSSSSSNIQADSQVWDPGGAGTLEGGGNTTASLTWRYDSPGMYTIRLTVTGDDGSTTFDEDTVSVPGL